VTPAPALTPGKWVAISPELLAETIVTQLDLTAQALAPAPIRVIVDGPRCASPGAIADSLVDPLRALGRPVVRASSQGFLRDASLRFEFGKTDVESFYSGWVDIATLRRELLGPLDPGGGAQVITSLRDPLTNRSTRADPIPVAAGTVVILDGELLLGLGLPAEFVVHVQMSASARARHTDPQWEWTLPAFLRYDDEVAPEELANLLIRADDPAHPAVQLR
jgi:hypothetical protein